MAHAVGHNLGRHPRFSHNAHPGGWWKFGLVALIATAVGVVFVYSPLLRGADRFPTPAPAAPITLGPAVPAYSESATAPAQAELAPPAAVVVPAQTVVAPTVANEARQLTIPAPAAVAEPADQNIRNVDLAALPVMQTLVRQLAGRIDKVQIKYADLTGDGNEDAVVPITSDGTYGNLAFVVFTERAGALQAILTRLAGRERRGLSVTFDQGQLAETSGVYGPFDANCCPGQIIKTYFRWDGQNLVFGRTDTITGPQGKQAN